MKNKQQKDSWPFLVDFFNIPKIKKKISVKELKKAYEEQYVEDRSTFTL